MMANSSTENNGLFGIAVVGMAGRFPGAKNINEYWINLRNGVESIGSFSADELAASGVVLESLKDPNYVIAGTVMPDADQFDAQFFGINKREAEIMDPQHRVFLETAWETLENAGYDPENYAGLIGVFGGIAPNTYYHKNLSTRPDILQTMGSYPVMLANEKEYAVTRVSFKLNLKGPSISINTACSTSGVAIHMACASLLNGECDMALAGGASITVPLKTGYVYKEGGIPSPDGHCRAFDAEAQGTVGGNGVGMIVLKRLEEAIDGGDFIYAVIKGSAINNDGSQKVGFTAPSIQGQAAVIEEALAMADVNPETIGMIEAHGTGTPLGDPIEIAALTKAYRNWTDKTAYCSIGSVKTNIGHLDAGAGIAGTIKAILALNYKQIPPSLNFAKPNPNIDFKNSPFYVNTGLSPWQTGDTPRRAGVSSFGLGGTNAHIVLEEFPEQEVSGPSRPQQLLLLSAKTKKALSHETENLVEHLRKHPDINLADVAFTLQTGRRAFEHRRIVIGQNPSEVVSALTSSELARKNTSVHKPIDRDIVFMFSGQGAQYVNMGKGLYLTEPVFKMHIDRCSELLEPYLNFDIREVLYPDEGNEEDAQETLTKTFVTQPALFCIEYALAQLWMSWGIQPAALVGHSIGEYVAACLSDVFSIEDAISLVATRGRLMGELPHGSMVAVPLPPRELKPYLNGNLELAVVNSPTLCVVSGRKEAVEAFEHTLAEKELAFTHLHTSHAFHSRMMDPILDVFAVSVKQIKLDVPKIPFVSNVSGTWITTEQAMDPVYWADHLRKTVRFSDCLHELMKTPNRIFLEIGPGRTLNTLAKQHPSKTKGHYVQSSIRHPKVQKSDEAFIMNTIGQMWLAGAKIDWSKYYETEKRHRVPLPTYPFERKHYWIHASSPISISKPVFSEVSVELEETSLDLVGDVQVAQTGDYEDAPGDAVEQSVADIWSDLLGVDQVGVHDDFFDLGGSSLVAVSLFAQIKMVFGKKLPLATLIEATTVSKLADILREEDWDASWSPLVEIQSGDSKPPFFFVHAAGGNILIYRELTHHLGPDQTVYGLQAQGLDGEQPILTKIEDMADLYIKEIQAVQPHGPYLLGGYCMGGTVALEIAQRLRGQGEDVSLLAFFETYNWGADNPDKSPVELMIYYLQKIEFHLRNFLILDSLGKWSFIREKAKVLKSRSGMWYGMIASRLGRKIQQRSGQNIPIAEIWEINERAPYGYEPKVYPGRITNFLPVIEYSVNKGPEMAWDAVASEGVNTHVMSVYPAGMMVEPFVEDLAAELKECIEEAVNNNFEKG